MSVFAERNKAGALTGTWIVKVMRHGVTTVHRTTDGQEAKRIELLLKAGHSLNTQAPAVVTMEDAKTLRWLLPHACGIYEGTKDYRQSTQRLEVAFGLLGLDKPVASIRTMELDALVATLRKRGLDNKTINRYLAPVSKALKWAHMREVIPSLPAVPRQPESEGRIAWLSHENEIRIKAWLDFRGRGDVSLIVSLLTATGFRINELLTRKPHHFMDGWLVLEKHETKNGKPRAAFIPGHLADPLAALLDVGFPHYVVVLKWLKAACESLGIEAITPHVLRHTTATRLNAMGETTATIMEYMGHMSVNTTMKYVHVQKESVRAAAERLAGGVPRGEALPLTRTITTDQSLPTNAYQKHPRENLEARSVSPVLLDFLRETPDNGTVMAKRCKSDEVAPGFAVLCVTTPPRGLECRWHRRGV
jgi:integrase